MTSRDHGNLRKTNETVLDNSCRRVILIPLYMQW